MKNRVSLFSRRTLEGWKRLNTSLVEKLNRTPGATPRSFCRGTLSPFLTYEQIKKLPASRKPAPPPTTPNLPRVTARPWKRYPNGEHGGRNSTRYYFQTCSPPYLPPPPLVLITDELYVIKPPPPIQCSHEILRSAKFVRSRTRFPLPLRYSTDTVMLWFFFFFFFSNLSRAIIA